MNVCDIVSFNEENYFNGAVQPEWFYDNIRAKRIAINYVFHGPKYYGVSLSDLSGTQHKLIDTATFAMHITDELYGQTRGNNFVMTIAGYGTGKSHLAVCLGELFSGNTELVNIITDNINSADPEIGAHIRSINTRPNFVIVLNGMANFNLDAEVLKCVNMTLEEYGINKDVLKKITKSYDIARHFVARNFSIYSDRFEESASEHGICLSGDTLRKHLIENVESDNCVIEIINSVYKDITGDTIRWDRGISAGDILTLIQSELCGENKPFNKVLILFDEFGRYIEYAAANPVIAGEASLQQIFEAIQTADGNILFVGFIQNDLSAYLSRIEKTANIIRYVGRYESGEKLYLSSNFETILANLLKKNEESGFSRIIENSTSRYEKYHKKIFSALTRWDKSAQKKSVWTSYSLYSNVILKGCFPLHPITTWLLSNTSSWMQQRSTIAFTAEMYRAVSHAEICGTWLPYIYPIDIVDSSIFDEMLNAEEKGLVQSQSCMLYRDITLKTGGKLSDIDLKVLKAILILNIGKFSLFDRNDAIQAISFCSNLQTEDIIPALKNLEDLFGVISFDENAISFDLIAEANGFNEFKRVFAKYRNGAGATIDDIDSNLMVEATLSGVVETSFAQEHDISSSEWVFEKRLIASDDIDSGYINMLRRAIDSNHSGEEPRGYLVYVYCNHERDAEIGRISALISEAKINRYPIIFLFLDDAEHEITDALSIKKVIARFSKADQERFQKHIAGQLSTQNKKIIQVFSRLIRQREFISDQGIRTYEKRITALCSDCFNEIYTMAPPFAFDGLQNKGTAQAKKYITNICIKLFDRTLMNIQSYQALTQDEKNRVKSCLAVDVSTSWQVFDSRCTLVKPKNELISSIYDELESELKTDEPKSVFQLTEKYTKPPYGMNANAVTLLIFYFIACKGNNLYCFYGQEKLTATHLSEKLFKSSKPQYSEINKIRLQLNPYAGTDLVAELCKKASSCTEITQCEAFRKEIETLTIQNGISAENHALVAQANIRLDEGIHLCNVVMGNNSKAREILNQAKSKFVIHQFVKIFDLIIDPTESLSDEYEFFCGESLSRQISTIKSDADALLRTNFPIAISKLTCDITQLSQWKSVYKRVGDILNHHGYIEYANMLSCRINELEKEIIAKQKYNSALGELEKDIALFSSPAIFSFRTTEEAIAKMERWNIFLVEKHSELPTSIASPLCKRVSTTISSLINHRAILLERVNHVLDEIVNAVNVGNLQTLKTELERTKLLEFDPQTEDRINDTLQDLRKRIAYIVSLPDEIDQLKLLESSSTVSSDLVISNELREKLTRLEAEQQAWMDEVVFLALQSSEQFTASECINWLEKTVSLPIYIEANARSEYIKAKTVVEKRLHSCRVEGVVSMFNSLSSEEKEQCLELLLQDK